MNKKKIVKTPVILQMEDVECGAASLAIILAYYGKYVSLEELRKECEVTRDGVNALNIVEAAKQYGLISEGYSIETKDLEEFNFPAIIFWNFNHFVVLEGFKKGKYYLNDPAIGPRVVSEEEFNKSFTGVILTFEKGKNFKKGGDKSNLFSLFKALKSYKTIFFFFILSGFLLSILGILIPTFTKIFIDEILIKKMSNWIILLLTGMVLTAIFRGILLWLHREYLLRFEEKLLILSSSRFFWHILRLPISFFTHRYAGEIGNRLYIINEIVRFFSRNLLKNLLNCIMLVFYAFVMFYYDITLTLLTIFIASLNIIFLYFISQKIKNEKLILLQERGKLIGNLISGLKIIETLKSMGRENDFFNKYVGYHAKVINAEQRLNLVSNILNFITESLSNINNFLVLLIGSFKVQEGLFTIGMLIAYQSLAVSFLEPVNSLVKFGGNIQEMLGNFKRIDDVMIQKEDPILEYEGLKNLPFNKLKGKIDIKDLTFGYGSKENPVIKNFNLSIPEGSHVAIVGKSGSGKSTISRLITGLYTQWEGEIYFDDIPRKNIPRPILNNSIALVDQNINIFEGTIKDNITLWDKSISFEDIINGCKDACINDIILTKYAGYKHKLQEWGKNFSEGEKQRLEIASALALNPSILVLDEATSSLDTLLEARIYENIKKRGCTCIIIAHRLSTIKESDQIIVLDKGVVVEKGTHEELIKINGFYSKLVTLDTSELY